MPHLLHRLHRLRPPLAEVLGAGTVVEMLIADPARAFAFAAPAQSS